MIPGEQLSNLHRLAPEVVLCVFGIIVMVADAFVKPSGKRALGWLSFIGDNRRVGICPNRC